MTSPGGTRYKTYTPNGGHYSPRGSRYSRDGTKVSSPNGTNLRHRSDYGSRTAAFVRTDGRIRSPGGREYRNHSPGRYNTEPARPRSPQQSAHRTPSSRPKSKDSDKSSVGSSSSTISKHRDGGWKLCKAYQEGHCARGEHCRAMHGPGDKRIRANLPDRAKTPVPAAQGKSGGRGKGRGKAKGKSNK